MLAPPCVSVPNVPVTPPAAVRIVYSVPAVYAPASNVSASVPASDAEPLTTSSLDVVGFASIDSVSPAPCV